MYVRLLQFHAKSAKIFKREVRKVALKSHLKQQEKWAKDTKDTDGGVETVPFVALSKSALWLVACPHSLWANSDVRGRI